jgi:hypothetical protein
MDGTVLVADDDRTIRTVLKTLRDKRKAAAEAARV